MIRETDKISILRIIERDRTNTEDLVVRESSLTIILNGHELVTMYCSPKNQEYLVVGFLLSEGLVKNKGDIKKIKVNETGTIAQVETGAGSVVSLKPVIASGGGKSAASAGNIPKVKTKARLQVSAQQVFSMMSSFIQYSRIFQATGGVHSAALCNTVDILLFSEDIGRHNAVDKVFGESLLRDIPADDSLIITSGRVSSEILLKVAKRNAPMLISVSAPTDLAVRFARELGITLIGFVRESRMNVYTHDERIID